MNLVYKLVFALSLMGLLLAIFTLIGPFTALLSAFAGPWFGVMIFFAVTHPTRMK